MQNHLFDSQSLIDMSPATSRHSQIRWRRFIYPALLLFVYTVWFGYMFGSNSWHLLSEFWPVSLTMSLGSFVAGATAEGGAAVAFPVFTKVLHIPATDARTFGLMIQAVGMTMAGAVIMLQQVKVLPRVITLVSLGGIVGQVVGTYWIMIPNPYPKILFTFITTAFGGAMIISRWWMNWTPREKLPVGEYRALFLLIGVFGGIFAAQTGSGIDMLTFIVLTLAFGINEKISTPTTVIIMGLNSVVGFFLHGVISQDIGIAWNYWLVAVPIVVVGAPFGAYVASKSNRDIIIQFLLLLILVELISTLLLIPFNNTAILITSVAVILSGVLFAAMLRYRQKRFAASASPINVDSMRARLQDDALTGREV